MNHNSQFKSFFAAGSALRVIAAAAGGLLALSVTASPVHAQDYTNVSATGRVVDANGNGIPNATVTVTSEEQGFNRSVTTNSSGSYRIAALPPGRYNFEVSAEGFVTFAEAGVLLNQQGASNQFALVPSSGVAAGGDGNTIVVSGTRTQTVDFDQTTTGAVINVADISNRVPVARDLTSIIQLAPGTAGGDSAFGNLASAVGSSVSENVFYLNGLNITEFREGLGSVTVPFDFYETVEIKNGGYAAEFGRATGAFVNATTKSGSNEFHGSVKFNWEPDWAREDQPNTLFADNDFDYEERVDMIAQLSGPIIKDRLFFYGLYNARNFKRRFADNPASGVRSFAEKSTSPFFGAKFDALIVDGQRLEFTYFNTENVTERNIYDGYDNGTNSVGPFSSTQVFETGGENYVGRYTGSFTDWLTVSAAYGKNENRDNTVSTNDALPFISDQRAGNAVSVGNPVNLLSQASDEREFYRADVDLYFEALGSHHIKVGYDREELTSVKDDRYTGNVAYTYLAAGANDTYGVAAGTPYTIARTFVNAGTFNSVNEAYYIQDNWSLLNDRLVLQLGLRNDRFTNDNVEGQEYYNSGDNWQPRIGVTFDPFDDGRTKLYGSFGRYFLPIAVNTNIRLGGSELDYDRVFLLDGTNADNTPILGDPVDLADCPAGIAGSNCILRNDGSVSPLDSLVASNLQNQSVDEYIVGAEQRVGDSWVFGLYGTYRSLNASLEDAAIDAGILNYCSDNGIAVTDCGDGDYFGAGQYALFNPGEDVTITPAYAINGSFDPITITADQLGYPAARRTYKAITFEFEREFDGVWGLQGSYTYSKNKGNIEGGVKSDNGQTDSGLTTDFDFPSLTLGSYGYLPNDRRHNFKIYGSYAINDAINFGANFILTSPRRFGCRGLVDAAISSPAEIRAGNTNDYGYAYGAESNFCRVDDSGNIITDPSNTGPRTLVPRGTAFKSDWLAQLDVDVAFRLPTDAFDAQLRVSVFNIFDISQKLDFQESGTTDGGTPRADYGSVTAYQQPRSIRFQFEVGF